MNVNGSHNDGPALLKMRDTGKLASTTITNELAEAVNGMRGGKAGVLPEHFVASPFAYVTPTENATGGGQYKGTFKLPDDLLVDTTKNVGDAGEIVATLKTNKCFIRNLAERGLSTHRITSESEIFGFFFGYAKDGDDILPVYTVRHYVVSGCS